MLGLSGRAIGCASKFGGAAVGLCNQAGYFGCALLLDEVTD